MKNSISVLFLIITLLACNEQKKTFHLENGIVINNAHIISSESDQITNYIGHIIIENDSIVFSGKIQPNVKGSFKTIDGSGKYVIPGLIDSHVHVGHPIGLRDKEFEENPKLVKAYFNQVPNSYLYFGFTSLVDLDLRESSRKRFESNKIRPTLYSAGRGLRYYNGYGQSLFPPKVRYKIFPNWVYDESQRDQIDISVDLSQHTVQAAIQNSIEADAICIKTYYETGFGAFNWPVPSDKLLKDIVNASHAKGMPVVLHSTSLESYQKGLKAGVDIFGHGLWHWDGSKLNSTPPAETETLYKNIAAQGRYVQSTMRVILGEYDTYKWSLINHPDLKHTLHKTFIAWLSTEEGKWAQKDLKDLYERKKKDKTVPNERYFETVNQRVANTVNLAYRNKVKLILGSDSPASEGIGNVPGLNGYLEMKALYEAGVDLNEIFIAATSRNAKAFGLDNQIGSIQNGKKADLLILKSNPLESIEAYNQIQQLILSGNIYERDQFSALNN